MKAWDPRKVNYTPDISMFNDYIFGRVTHCYFCHAHMLKEDKAEIIEMEGVHPIFTGQYVCQKCRNPLEVTKV